MKIIKILFVAMLGVFLLPACKKPVDPEPQKSSDTSIKGITAYCLSASRGRDELTASLDKSKLTIILTTEALYSDEVPVDLTNVIIELSLAAGATADLRQSYDLSDQSKAAKITVTAEDGQTTETWNVYAVRTDPMIIIPTSVSVTATPVWSKTAAELNLKSPLWGSRGMCTYRENGTDYLYVLDNVLPYSDDNKIRIFNAKTAAYIGDISGFDNGRPDLDPGCRSYMWACNCDEAGHVAITRLNADQAGFFLDLYDNAAGGWKRISTPLKLSQDAPGLTYYAGKKVQILGNLVSGRGMVLATWGHFYGHYLIQGGYDIFSFNDGEPSSSIDAQTYPCEWWAGEVQQESLIDETKYITWTFETDYDIREPEEKWPYLHAAHFELSDPVSGKTYVVSQECFNYRILAAKVFNCGSGKYLYTLEQKYLCTSPYVERLYYISDREMLKTINPSSEDWTKFMLWEREDDMGGDDQEYHFGSVSVLPDESGNSAVLFSYHASSDSEKAKITATRVTFNETF